MRRVQEQHNDAEKKHKEGNGVFVARLSPLKTQPVLAVRRRQPTLTAENKPCLLTLPPNPPLRKSLPPHPIAAVLKSWARSWTSNRPARVTSASANLPPSSRCLAPPCRAGSSANRAWMPPRS